MFTSTILFVCLCVGALGRRVPNNSSASGEHHAGPTDTCHYSDPNVADCIRNVAENTRHLLAQGVPALGVQSLEPLKVPSIRLRQHNMPKSGFKYDAWLTDIMIKGLTNYTFNNLDVFPDDLKVTANISLPRLEMTSDYVVLGEFQMLPVESSGKLSANFSSCTASIVALGARVHKRMLIRDATVHLRCAGDLKASLDDAHSTTGEMEMITDHIAAMHSEDIVKEIQPAVETSLAMVLEDVANKFLKHVPSDMVFPN